MSLNNQNNRAPIFFWLAVAAFTVLAGRVFYLQFIGDDQLKKRAHGNKIRTTVIEPARGRLYDRNGVLLVDNQHAYNLYVVPEVLLNNQTSLNFVAALFKDNPESLRIVLSDSTVEQNQEFRLRRDVGLEIFAKLEEQGGQIRGVKVKNEWKRTYPLAIAPHILGYVGEAKQESEFNEVVKAGDLCGKEGVEFAYDLKLRGKRGVVRELRDVHNRKISDYNPEEWIKPERGKDIWLTIDAELQLFIEDLFKDKSGAVVVTDCRNGEILAMTSKPDYPAELFSKSISSEEWKKWSENPEKPLYNKAIMGEYPPGSVLKMAVALAAFDQGIADVSTSVVCRGGLQVGSRFIKCWNKYGHGSVNVISALMGSCDTYFYQLAYRINLDKWAAYLNKWGLGEKTGIDLRYEKSGNIPNRDYYKIRNREIPTGNLAILMIGQGEILTTPLQIACYTAYLANGGQKIKPHLFYKSGIDSATSNYPMPGPTKIEVSQNNLDLIHQGMYAVVNSGGGTANQGASSVVRFAGKTGTAQNPHGADHAWFTAYGPYKNPDLVVTIFEEYGMHGASLSPMARSIFEKWHQIKNRKPGEKPVIELKRDSLKL